MENSGTKARPDPAGLLRDLVSRVRSRFGDPSDRATAQRSAGWTFLLRVANWLHLNRGKKAWTWVADGYAVLLLYLATSGLFMLPGKKGFFGRGAILFALGVAVPIGYVVFSGGP